MCENKQLPNSSRLLFSTHYLYAVMLLETFFPLFCLLESLPMACFTLILVEHQNSYNPWLVHIHCVPCVPLTPHAQLTNNNQCQVAMSRMMDKLNRWQMWDTEGEICGTPLWLKPIRFVFFILTNDSYSCYRGSITQIWKVASVLCLG